MPYATVDETRLWYEFTGPEDQPLILERIHQLVWTLDIEGHIQILFVIGCLDREPAGIVNLFRDPLAALTNRSSRIRSKPGPTRRPDCSTSSASNVC